MDADTSSLTFEIPLLKYRKYFSLSKKYAASIMPPETRDRPNPSQKLPERSPTTREKGTLNKLSSI